MLPEVSYEFKSATFSLDSLVFQKPEDSEEVKG